MQNCSSHLHVASIMNDRTEAEKETFGSLPLNLNSPKDIDRAIEIYLTQLREPLEILTTAVEQSRDRLLRELSKFEAEYEMRQFFSEEGVKARKETIKLKVLTGGDLKRKASEKSDQGQDKLDLYFKMMLVHNFKVQKIVQGFVDRQDKKK